MPRFTANISTLFTELPFPERFTAAAQAGFKAVECQLPYGFDKKLLAEHAQSSGLPVNLFNIPPGNQDTGERGIACLPDRVKEYRQGVLLALDYAQSLGCRKLCVPSGIVPPDLEAAKAEECFVANLDFTVRILQDHNIMTLIEPINGHDVPGIFLQSTAQALKILADVDSENLFLEYDVYHMHYMGEDIFSGLIDNIKAIANIQIADYPGRHQPGTGEINFPRLFSLIDTLDYTEWVGCEYLPSGNSAESVGFIHEYSLS